MLNTHYTGSEKKLEQFGSANPIIINGNAENSALQIEKNAKAKKQSTLVKIAGGVLGLSLLTTAAFFAGSAAGKSGKNPEVSPPVATESVEPSESSEPVETTTVVTISESSAPAESSESTQTSESTEAAEATPSPEIEQNQEYTIPIFEQTKSIEEMDKMSLERFAMLSFADRTAYANEKLADRGFELSSETIPDGFYPEDVPGSYWQYLVQCTVGDTDKILENQKIGTVLFYYSTELITGRITESCQGFLDDIANNAGPDAQNGARLVYVANGEPHEGMDREGNPITYINITYDLTNESTGETLKTYTTQTIHVGVKLLNGKLIHFYARLYGADGQQSPIQGMPY